MDEKVFKKAKRQVERLKIFIFSSIAFVFVSVIILPVDYFVDSKFTWSVFPIIIWLGAQMIQLIQLKFNYFWEEKEIEKIMNN